MKSVRVVFVEVVEGRSIFSKLLLLCICLFSLITLPACHQKKAVISGKLTVQGTPIQNAKVSLNVYKDENCTVLLEKTHLSEEEEKQLKDCKEVEVAKVMSDSQGQYTFQDLSPGWYKVDAVFDLSASSGSSSGKGMNRENEGEFNVHVLSALDSEGNGVRHWMAFGKQFYIPAGANVVKNLNY